MIALIVIGIILSILLFLILGIVITGYTSYGDIKGFAWKINKKQLYSFIPILITTTIVLLIMLLK